MPSPGSKDWELVTARLARARRVVALTGAGVSAESGVPTFRGAEGLWKSHRAEDLATPEAFLRDPRLVWEWYDWRRGILKDARPNAAHKALAALEGASPVGWTIVTQNVDGLHQQAGSRDVIELHGSIWRLRCTACAEVREDRRHPLEGPPRCGCGAIQRPDVVWFGETIPTTAYRRTMEALATADFLWVIGTSGVVQPAASFALQARESGAFVAEVNVERTPLSSCADATLLGRAGEILARFAPAGAPA